MQNSVTRLPDLPERTFGAGQTDLLLQMEEDYSLIANSPMKSNDVGELRSWTRIMSPKTQKKQNRAYLENKRLPTNTQQAFFPANAQQRPGSLKKLSNTTQSSGWRSSFHFGQNSEAKDHHTSKKMMSNRSAASFLISTPTTNFKRGLQSGQTTPEAGFLAVPSNTTIRLGLPRAPAASFMRPTTPSVVTLLNTNHTANMTTNNKTVYLCKPMTHYQNNDKNISLERQQIGTSSQNPTGFSLSTRDAHLNTPLPARIGLLDGSTILRRATREPPRGMPGLQTSRNVRSFHSATATTRSLEDRAQYAINRTPSATAAGFYRPKSTKPADKPTHEPPTTAKIPTQRIGLQAAAALNKNRFFVGKIRRAIANDSRPAYIAEKDWESLKINRGFVSPQVSIPYRL